MAKIPYAICFTGVLLATTLSGCLMGRLQSNLKYEVNPSFSSHSGQIGQGGLAFVTPLMPTGREQDMQTVALLFFQVMREQHKVSRLLPMSETIGIVNQHGMLPKYRAMYDDYQLTGMFPRDTLNQLSDKLGVRYLAQLKLASFNQRSDGRFGMSGFKLLFIKEANVRMFMQIWDAHQGEIVWEGSEEVNYSRDTPMLIQIPFRQVVEQAATNLIKRMPT